MTLYATLADARVHDKSTSTTDDAILLNNLRIVSRRVDRLFAARLSTDKTPHYFAPYIAELQFMLDRTRINSLHATYRLAWPLLALSAVTAASEALVVGTKVEGWPTIRAPYPFLRLMDGDTWYSFCPSSYEPVLIQVTGTWGVNDHWADAWLDVTTLAAAISDTTGTSITLTDIDGVDAYGRTPWISAGALLQIDSEWLEVTATDTGTNVATVRRGVNGSTAATHDNGATVSVYQVDEDLRDVVARQAAFKYARRGAFEQTTITDLGQIQYPADLLAELRGVVMGYASQ